MSDTFNRETAPRHSEHRIMVNGFASNDGSPHVVITVGILVTI